MTIDAKTKEIYEKAYQIAKKETQEEFVSYIKEEIQFVKSKFINFYFWWLGIRSIINRISEGMDPSDDSLDSNIIKIGKEEGILDLTSVPTYLNQILSIYHKNGLNKLDKDFSLWPEHRGHEIMRSMNEEEKREYYEKSKHDNLIDINRKMANYYNNTIIPYVKEFREWVTETYPKTKKCIAFTSKAKNLKSILLRHSPIFGLLKDITINYEKNAKHFLDYFNFDKDSK